MNLSSLFQARDKDFDGRVSTQCSFLLHTHLSLPPPPSPAGPWASWERDVYDPSDLDGCTSFDPESTLGGGVLCVSVHKST